MTVVSVLTIKATKEAVPVHIEFPFFHLTKQANKKNKSQKAPPGATRGRPQPGSSKRSILMIPDKIVRRYPPGCNDTLHYTGRIDSEDDMSGSGGGSVERALQCTHPAAAGATRSI